MGLFSFLFDSLDASTSIIVLIITLIGVYWFWFKPRSSKPTKSEDVIKTIKNLQTYVENDFHLNKIEFFFYFRDSLTGKMSGAAPEGSFVDRMIHSEKTMVVFYGSQTGTAEDFAQRIAKQAKRYGISATVCDPEECDMVSH